MPKKILNTSITGELGIDLIRLRVHEMGHLWHEYGQVEAGVDGLIELRIPESSIATNSIIQVQSRATENRFDKETESSFEYRCTEADLAYWLEGNCPIIFVRSRPKTNEVYWKNLKEYFNTPEKRAGRIILFDKSQDVFDKNASNALLTLAVPPSIGLCIPVPKASDLLYSNLLPLRVTSPSLFVGMTQIKSRPDFLDAVYRAGITDQEWALKGSRVISFVDLEKPEWKDLVDSVERHEPNEWLDASDILIENEVRELLRRTVSTFLKRKGLRYSKTAHCFYFQPSKNLQSYEYEYRGIVNETAREVFGPRAYKKAVSFYRHSAIEFDIEKLDRTWHLVLSPTYYFTYDGFKENMFREERLSKMKRLDRHAAVFGQVVMWQRFFVEVEDLFNSKYPFVEFGDLLTAETGLRIPDEYWQKSDANKDLVPEDVDLELFEPY
jgi:hypothetical protein